MWMDGCLSIALLPYQHCAAVCEAYCEFISNSIVKSWSPSSLPIYANEALAHMDYARSTSHAACVVQNIHRRLLDEFCSSEAPGRWEDAVDLNEGVGECERWRGVERGESYYSSLCTLWIVCYTKLPLFFCLNINILIVGLDLKSRPCLYTSQSVRTARPRRMW